MRYTRRQTLAGLGVASGAALSGRRAFAQMVTGTVARRLPAANIAVLTPQAVEGPFYVDNRLERADIAEGHEGVPLGLLLQVVEASDCSAIAGARIDVWHANALGCYSGYQAQGDDRNVSTERETFLRGTQFTNSDGEASFATIYPGWYIGRTPHVHFKVFLDDNDIVTGQIYFPDALSEFIYANVAPYNARNMSRDTTNDRDSVLLAGGGRETFCSIREEADRYLAALIIGIDRAGKPSTPGTHERQAADTRDPAPGSERRGSFVPGA